MNKIVVILLCWFTHAVFGQDELKVTFSPIGGVYEKEITVTLDAGEGATIYYTTDATSPGSYSRRYKEPITITGVTVLRAVAYKDGKRSRVITNTYVCDREYNLPVVSLVTDSANLWNYSTGIYVKGCCADTVEPYMGANYWRDWEKPANIEMYDENGQLCFNQQAGIGIFGGFSRMLPMKSLAVFARKKYGDNRFRYQIFKEKDIDKHKSFILRNSGGDFKRTHLRDAFMTQLAKPTGLAYQAYQPAVVFINGRYWGIQNIREKINEHYLKYNYGVDKNNVDILRQNGVRRHGSSTNYKKLLAYLRSHDLSNDDNVAHLRTFMDIDDFIRYNIAEVYSDNRDAGGNIRYWRERNDSAKWRWVFYDLDQGLGNNAPQGYKRNTLKKFTSVNNEAWPDPPWSTFIIRKLLENKALQEQYITTFADHLNTVYHPDTANKLLDSMISVIDYEMHFHQKRWKSSYENWQHHLGILRKFITIRPYYCRQHIMEKFGIDDTVSIKIIHPGLDKCKIKFNSLKITDDFEGIYFKDVPVTISVKPKHDWVFKGWKDQENGGTVWRFNPQQDMVLEPIIEPRPRSIFTDSIIFNEIAYFQPKEDTSGDWIELYNNSASAVDLSGWTLTERSFKGGWKIPDGTYLESGKYLVLAENLKAFRTKFSADSISVIGDFEFGFSRDGELIKLYDQEEQIVDSLNYGFICPELPDTSFTAALIHPDSSKTDLHWRIESPTPGNLSQTYLDYLEREAEKRYWTKVFYIGGGSFFFILVVGILLFRYFKKRKRSLHRAEK
ncbi:MAG: CotH kinase family protein [Crocinitomicaceae bacterium]|nr:CotH kinase family protein [Crocinitomicaceae bacterium]